MFRKTVLALSATAALAVVALAPTSASAWGRHHHHGLRSFGVVVVAPAYYSCWRTRYIETRRGLRRVMVNVCY